MEQATMIGLDIAKHVFQVHGADGAGHVLLRKRVTRVKLLSLTHFRTLVAASVWRDVAIVIAPVAAVCP